MIVYEPTGLAAVAAVVTLELPVTPEVARVSLFLKPLIVAVNGGLVLPYVLDALLAVTDRTALFTASVASPGVSAGVPLVRLARTINPASDLEYVTPLIVTELVPAAIDPISVPARTPDPTTKLRVTGVLAATTKGTPADVWA